MINSKGKIILTSRGLNTRAGTELIYQEIKDDYLEDKTIFLVCYK